MSDSNDGAEIDVGQRLRSIRLGRRLTLKQVAELAGIAEGFLSQIETGRSAPSSRPCRKIAAALGLDPSDVLDSNDSPLPRLVHATSGRTISIGDVSKFRVTPPSMHSLEIIRGELKVGGTTGERYTHGDSDERWSMRDRLGRRRRERDRVRAHGRGHGVLPQLDGTSGPQRRRHRSDRAVDHLTAELRHLETLTGAASPRSCDLLQSHL